MLVCPICRTKVKLSVHAEKENARVVITPELITKNLVREALFCYFRWVAEGKKEYREDQWYYDNYHKEIKYKDNDTYSYRIQTFDSPDGDIWISGNFKIKPNFEIEFLEESS